MPNRSKALLLLLPMLALAGQAVASDYCDMLAARLNQMPQLIGSSTSAHYKSESLYRLNRLEIAIRRDMRRLDCPTNSIVIMNGNQYACSGLGEELASVRAQKQDIAELQPILSQPMDDGSGLTAAILKEIKRAGCDMRGTQQDVEIIGGAAMRNPAPEEIEARPVAWGPEENGDAAASQDLATVLGDDAESDYGTPEPYGMIEIRPNDTKEIEAGKMASVTLPKLEGQDLLNAPGSIDVLKTSPPAARATPEKAQAAVPERDYNPNDPKIRKVGPSFLAEKENGIELGDPSKASVVR